jgi:demethylmenaquinone methyltransferase / 2-methoxy-6-polyprenyl-1,4-benzoquinol methylase
MFESKSSKKTFIRKMFDDISDHYDFINKVISLGLDGYCRRKTVKLHSRDKLVLDICSGTGDMALELIISPGFKGILVLGDFSMQMHILAKRKFSHSKNQSSDVQIFQVCCDAENLPFKNYIFDGIISGYSLRNLGDLQVFGGEINRVLNDGGLASFVDVAHPPNRIYAWLFYIYFYKLIPLISKLFTRKKYAYRYLPASLRTFYKQDEVLSQLCSNGLTGEYENVLKGAVAIYRLKR